MRVGSPPAPLLGGSFPTSSRQKSIHAQQKRARYVLIAIAVLVGLGFVSFFFVDVDDVDKAASQHHALSTRGGAHEHDGGGEAKAPGQQPHGPKPGYSLVKRRPVAASITQKVRIYIYNDVVPAPLNRNLRGKEACWQGYAGNEVLLPELIASTTAFTSHGEVADFYLVPIASECFISSEMKRGMDYRKAHDALNEHFSRAMDAVQSRYPFWAASEGRDHLFVFPSERGASTLSPENALRIRKSVFLTGPQRRDPEWVHFNPHKDLVLPPAASMSPSKGSAGGDATLGDIRGEDEGGGEDSAEAEAPAAQDRGVFLYFRGSLPGLEDQGAWGLRASLASVLQKEPGINFRPSSPDCTRSCSLEEMRQATFCLVPEGGVEGWSLRLFHSIQQGCIPVILADQWELPYQDVLDWSKFSIKVLETDAEEVVEILRGLPRAAIESKAAELSSAAIRLRWHSELRPNDALDTLMGVLDNRVRFMRNSPYRFWKDPSEYGRRR